MDAPLTTTEEGELKAVTKKVFSSIGFRTVSLLLVRLISILRVFIFARIFIPDELGTATLALGCMSIISTFGNFGFFESVIRDQNRSSSLHNTAFTLSLALGTVLLIPVFFGAPLISKILSADLDSYIRFLAFMVFSIPLQFPKVFWEKDIRFAHPSVALVLPEVFSLITAVGIEIAFNLGVWSLLIGHAVGFLLSSIYIWFFAEIRPRIRLDREQAQGIMQFGTPFMLRNINGEVMSRGDNLMVAAYAGTKQLAYYNFAWQLPMMISSLTSTVDKIIFPVYARFSENNNSLSRLFNFTNKIWSIAGSFFGFPMILFADQIIFIFLGPNWEPAAPILKVMTCSFIIRFCTGYGYDNLALVRGRTKYLMKWSFINSLAVLTLGQYLIKNMGPIGGAWFWVLQSLILVPLVRLPLIYQELKSLEYLHHIWQPLVSGLLAFLCSYALIQVLPGPDPARSLIALLGYLMTYLGFLLAMDRQLILDIKKVFQLAREQ